MLFGAAGDASVREHSVFIGGGMGGSDGGRDAYRPARAWKLHALDARRRPRDAIEVGAPGSRVDRGRDIDRLRDGGRRRFLPQSRGWPRPPGRDSVYGPRLVRVFPRRRCTAAAGGATARPTAHAAGFGPTPVLEFGLGYAAASAVRLEALAEYRPHFAFEGRANFLAPGRQQSVEANLSSLSALLVAYIDLSGLGVRKLGPLEPFVGAGVGAVHTRIGETRMTFPKTTTIVPRSSGTDVAWMLTAGFGVPLGERTRLDLAWRYTDLGVVRTGRGGGRVVWRDGSREPRVLDLAETSGKLRGHGLRVSLRYVF